MFPRFPTYVFSPVLWLKSVDVTSHLPWWRWIDGSPRDPWSSHCAAWRVLRRWSFLSLGGLQWGWQPLGMDWFALSILVYSTVCWCLLSGMFMDIFFRKQGKNTCFTVSQLLVALLYVQLHTTRQHCSKTHHSSDPKGWSGHMERVSYVQEVWSGPVEKVLNLHKLTVSEVA